MSRHIYYKFLTSNKNYVQAITLVLENISVLESGKKDDYKLLHYLKQLYSLYGLTGQLEKEELTLLRLLNASIKLLGRNDEDNIKIILDLAKNYCLQKKLEKFTKLVTTHHLRYFCKYESPSVKPLT